MILCQINLWLRFVLEIWRLCPIKRDATTSLNKWCFVACKFYNLFSFNKVRTESLKKENGTLLNLNDSDIQIVSFTFWSIPRLKSLVPARWTDLRETKIHVKTLLLTLSWLMATTKRLLNLIINFNENTRHCLLLLTSMNQWKTVFFHVWGLHVA